jgi:hypothetical protein
MTVLLGCCALAALAPQVACAADPMPAAERARVERLLDTIGKSRDVKFIRNGTAHDAATTVRFLRAKWERYADKVHTAEDFIREVATQSITSGDRYRVRKADGSEEDSAAYLGRLLAAKP